MAELVIPKGVTAVLSRIRAAGFEGYLVGGCVRDYLMGFPPHDYDVTTSALPEEMLKIFEGARVIETGLQHGTVTVLTEDGPVEVTTYRQDGVYSDHRHPDGVTFTRCLREDLARRDFTVNAMAMNGGEVVDLFGGQQDLRAGVLRCVGEAERRFEEDALRILRGLRFAARLGFSLEEHTVAAIFGKKHLLKEIARERIFAELSGLLLGDHAPEVVGVYGAVLQEAVPQLRVDSAAQEALARCPAELPMRMACLLEPSAAAETLRSLKVSNDFARNVLFLVREREKRCPAERVAVRRCCVEYGAESFLMLCRFQENDTAESVAKQLLEEGVCLSLRELAVSGRELAALGYHGPAIGEKLAFLLEEVTQERVPNQRQALLELLQ